MKLKVCHCEDTDTLSFLNGEPVRFTADLANNLLAACSTNGEAAGSTLEHASQAQLPVLQSALQAREGPAGKPFKPAKSSS